MLPSLPDAAWLQTSLGHDDFMLHWAPPDEEELAAASLKSPFTGPPKEGFPLVEYSVNIHWANDYVYVTDEVIAPFRQEDTRCGSSVEYDPFPPPRQPSFFKRLLGWAEEPAPRTATPVFETERGRLRRACDSCGREFDPSGLEATVGNGWTGAQRRVKGGATYRFALTIEWGCTIGALADEVGIRSDFVGVCQQALGCPLEEVVGHC
jgi:hypothetical protein